MTFWNRFGYKEVKTFLAVLRIDDDCCLDARAAFEMVLKKESSALFKYFIAEADLVIAPTLLIKDATNLFWKYQNFQKFLCGNVYYLLLSFCTQGLPGVAESTF